MNSTIEYKDLIERMDKLEERIKQLEDAWAECYEESECIERVKNSDENHR